MYGNTPLPGSKVNSTDWDNVYSGTACVDRKPDGTWMDDATPDYGHRKFQIGQLFAMHGPNNPTIRIISNSM